MVDIHSHILPGLDDGSRSLEESVEMLRLAAEAGTTDIVASPHASLEYSFDPALVAEKIAELAARAGPTPRIYPGCDFHLQYDNIQKALVDPAAYTINRKSYLLVEFSDLLILKTTDEIFDRLQGAGMRPVITHPERNWLLQNRIEKIEEWVGRGVYLQVTAQSFLGRFGERAKRFAHELMKRRLVHFVASDAHDAQDRTPRLDEAHRYVAKKYGLGVANRLFVTNPACALEGFELDLSAGYGEEAEEPPRKWYEFWRS